MEWEWESAAENGDRAKKLLPPNRERGGGEVNVTVFLLSVSSPKEKEDIIAYIHTYIVCICRLSLLLLVHRRHPSLSLSSHLEEE